MPENERGNGDRLHPERWRTLAAIADVDPPATVDEITDELHERRPRDDPIADLEPWDRTHQRLHEVDLPALDAAGLIEFDETRGLVRIPPGVASDDGPPMDVAGDAGELTGSVGRLPWHSLYLGASIVSLGVVTSATVLEPGGDLSPVAALGVVALFALIALGHASLGGK